MYLIEMGLTGPWKWGEWYLTFYIDKYFWDD
jgi:hypothetical protein